MRGSSIGYLIREGARNLYVNRLMSLASIGVLMACMLLIGASVLLSVNLNSAMERLEDQNEVVLFLEMGTEDYQIEEVQQMLDEIDNLQSVEFVSAQEAFEIQRERLGEDAVLLDGLEDDNPFPASFQVQVDDLSQFAATVQELEALPYIEKANTPTDLAETITSIKQAVRVGSYTIEGILALVALVIISNTIRITVFSRKREINIMKWVGATNSFIKLPFIVEGMLIGLIAAVLAFGLLWGGYYLIGEWVVSSPSVWVSRFSDMLVPFGDIALRMLGAFALTGILIGGFGSMIFVRKYLKV